MRAAASLGTSPGWWPLVGLTVVVVLLMVALWYLEEDGDE